jgi:hypothetical protein
MPWLALLGVIPIGVISNIAYDRFSGKAQERKERRREGSSIITPAKELVNGLGPEGIMWGTDEQCDEYLNKCHSKWWDELRPPLMVFVNSQESKRVRKLGDEYATSVGVALSATRYLLLTRKTATDMTEYYDAQNAKEKSMALADDFMHDLRRRWPWLRLPRLRLLKWRGRAPSAD